jgi:hypothetical protein
MAGFKDLIDLVSLATCVPMAVSLDVSYWNCHHLAIVNADPWSDRCRPSARAWSALAAASSARTRGRTSVWVRSCDSVTDNFLVISPKNFRVMT